jgi:arylsulfatase A-like enzyme
MRNIIFLITTFFLFHPSYAQQNVKPNILFIAIDDLKPTIGSFDDSLAVTPNLDALSHYGTVFLNNHTQQAICGPSRASLLTGKRPDYTMVWDLKTKMRDVNPNILTIPQYFKENGYQSIGIGKIFDPRCVDNDRDKPSWSIPFIKENLLEYPIGYHSPELGFYQSKEITNKIKEIKSEAKKKGVKNLNSYVRERYKPPVEIGDVPDEAYVDGAIAVKTVELLDGIDKSKPFFLAVGFKRPHLPFVAPRAYWELYREEQIKIAEYQKKSQNAVDIAYHNSGEMRSYKSPDIQYELNEHGLLNLEHDLQKKLIHGYYASTSYIDALIGKIIHKLKKNGLYDNTIIVVWGDHGWHLGDHSLWNKHSNIEQATRSPLIIFDPRINIENRIKSPTEFVDIFPTLCDLSGLEIPENLDGISLKSQIKGESNTSKVYAVSQYPRGKKMGYSFRTDQYRYTVWIENKKSTDSIYMEDVVGEELYDYYNDPIESENKIDLPNYQRIKLTFQSLAARYFKSQLISVSLEDNEDNHKTIQKNKYADERSSLISSYIVSKMKLSEKQAIFLKETLYKKYAINVEKVHGKGLSQSQKQLIYKDTYSSTRTALLTYFKKNQVDEISKLESYKQKELAKVK